MKCAQCVASGKRSVVYPPRAWTTTLMGYTDYYDEEGAYHLHDPNTSGGAFHCSLGHNWTVVKRRQCPAEGCTYGTQEAS